MSPAFTPLTGKAAASVHLATRRINIWDGAVRSGKTVSSILAWIQFVRHAPPGDLLMVGKTERALKRNIIGPIMAMLGPHRVHLVEGSGELFLLGRKIWLAGGNDARSENKIRGMTLVGAYIDEATIIPEDMWRMIGTRLSIPGARLYATTNPDSKRHWLKTSVLDRVDTWITPDGSLTTVRPPAGASTLDAARFSFTLADNPHLDPAYLTALEAEYTGLWRRRYILGEWVIAEGAIYDMWDPDRHIVEPSQLPDNRSMVGLGVDYGTTHRFAAELIESAAESLWVTDEWMWDSEEQHSKMSSVQYQSRMRAWLGPRRPPIFVDPAAADFRTLLRQKGVRRVSLANNAVLPGIRTIASLLSAGRLQVSAAAEGLIDRVPGYVWDPKAALRGVEQPLKEADDEPDALRYGVYTPRHIWRHDVPLTITDGDETDAATGG